MKDGSVAIKPNKIEKEAKRVQKKCLWMLYIGKILIQEDK